MNTENGYNRTLNVCVHLDKFCDGTECRRIDFKVPLSNEDRFFHDDTDGLVPADGAEFLPDVVALIIQSPNVDHVRVRGSVIEVKGNGAADAQRDMLSKMKELGIRAVVSNHR